MQIMIRSEDDNPKRSKAMIWAGAVMLIVLGFVISCAYLLRSQLSASANIFLAGLGGVALLGLLSIIYARKNMSIHNRRLTSRKNLYSEAFFNSSNPSLIMHEGKILHANAAYFALAKSLGVFLSGQETLANNSPTIERLFASAGKNAAASIFRLHHMSIETEHAEEIVDVIAPDQSLQSFVIYVRRLPNSPAHLHWEIVDISETRALEATLLSDAPVGLFVVDETGRVLATNAVLNRWIGGDINEPPKQIESFIKNPKALLDSPAQSGRNIRTDTHLITRKGVVTPTLMVGSWSQLLSGDMVASVALYGHSTLTVHKTEQGSDKAAPNFQPVGGESLFAAPVAVLQIEGEYLGTAKIKSANAAFERMSGITDWQDMPFSRIFAPKDGEHHFLKLEAVKCSADRPYDATLTGAQNLAVSTYIVAHEGAGFDKGDEPQILPVTQNDNLALNESAAHNEALDAGDSIDERDIYDPQLAQYVPDKTHLYWIYLVDISARKSLEDQLRQSQKMQAIGQLAAGVAHDFNNLLTAIRLNTDELLQRHPVGDPSYPELRNINMSGARAAALVKKLLAFSRKQTRRMELLNVTDTLSDMVLTLKQTLGERAKLTMVYERGLPPIMADKSQIDTILMNLCVNARDAMQAQGGGEIEVRSALLKRSDITDSNLLEALEAIAGEDFVVISVKDTGTGMSDEIKAKVFEPFFTTKELGKGTGLGLATVYGIVQQTGGHLDLQSELGVGTTFRIFLPAADMELIAQAPAAKKAAAPRAPSDLAGQGNILFVEDEISVRDIAAKSLRKRGYTVIEAEDGEEALEILEDAQTPFDLMISDVVMPGLGGPDLLKQGRELLGQARIVFISGYAEEEFSELLSEEPDVTFLPKPFTLAQLAEKVKMEIGEVAQ